MRYPAIVLSILLAIGFMAPPAMAEQQPEDPWAFPEVKLPQLAPHMAQSPVWISLSPLRGFLPRGNASREGMYMPFVSPTIT